MKRFTLSVVHILLVLCTLFLCTSRLQGGFPRVGEPIEMIAYRLVPNKGLCELEIEFVSPTTFLNMYDIQKNETREALTRRIAYEVSVPFERSQVFAIDDKLYFLIQVPYDGISWGN